MATLVFLNWAPMACYSLILPLGIYTHPTVLGGAPPSLVGYHMGPWWSQGTHGFSKLALHGLLVPYPPPPPPPPNGGRRWNSLYHHVLIEKKKKLMSHVVYSEHYIVNSIGSSIVVGGGGDRARFLTQNIIPFFGRREGECFLFWGFF